MRIPASAFLLGVAGLIPFFWGALLSLGIGSGQQTQLPQALRGDGALLMVRYGGIILPFMSGVLWGFATKASGKQAASAYALSVVPALWWFFAIPSGSSSALINLMAGFAGLLILDFAFSKWGLAPGWWMRLRVQLTVAVLACLAVGAWA